MNRSLLSFCTVCTLLTAMGLSLCHVGHARPHSSQQTALSAPQLALFYYTEGLKNNLTGGDSTRSIQLFKTALEADSTHAPSMYELSALVAPHDMDQALSLSRNASRLDPSNTWYRIQLGRWQMSSGAYDQAEQTYTTLIANDPVEPDNYRLLTWLYMQQGHNDQALAVLDSADSRLGMVEELAQMRLGLLIEIKRFDEALTVARLLTDNFPKHEDNFVALGDLYAQLHDDDKAQAAYDQAIAIHPNSLNALASLTSFYGERNDTRFMATARQLFKIPDLSLQRKIQFFQGLVRTPNFYRNNYAAMGDLLMALRLTHPRSYDVLQLYARHQVIGGQPEVALQLLKSVLRDTTTREVYTDIIDLESYLKRSDSTMLYMNRAVASFPHDPELYLRRAALTTYLLNQPKEALVDYRHALKYATTDSLRSIIYGSMGDTYHTLNNFKQCFAAYDRGLRYDSTNIAICNNYSYFLSLRNERLDEALRMAERATRLSPNNSTFMDTYAWVLYQLGRYEQARTVMRQAIAFDNENNKELYLHYGDILFKLNETFMATFYWKKAAEFGYDATQIEQRLKQVEP